MKTQQSGFTLIELVMVIVILGILAAVAVPKFIDLSDDAQQSAVDGLAGALSSAAAINYAGCSVTGVVTAGKCVAVAACADVNNLLQAPVDTAEYTIAGAFPACTIAKGGMTANFQAIAAP